MMLTGTFRLQAKSFHDKHFYCAVVSLIYFLFSLFLLQQILLCHTYSKCADFTEPTLPRQPEVALLLYGPQTKTRTVAFHTMAPNSALKGTMSGLKDWPEVEAALLHRADSPVTWLSVEECCTGRGGRGWTCSSSRWGRCLWLTDRQMEWTNQTQWKNTETSYRKLNTKKHFLDIRRQITHTSYNWVVDAIGGGFFTQEDFLKDCWIIALHLNMWFCLKN